MLLKRKKEIFSNVFYERHRQHVLRLIRKSALYAVISGTLAVLFVLACFFGKGTVVEAGVGVAVFLWIVFGISIGLPRGLRARLVPYFEQHLGDAETWNRGKGLLENSRRLDDLAVELGVPPLSEFASGDDLVPGEKLVWFEPQAALETVEKLLQSDAAKDFSPDLTADLSSLRDALTSVSEKGVRFNLLLREGSSASGAEIERRKGHFS